MAKNDEFRRNFQKLIKRAKDKARDVCVEGALSMANGMVEKCPVDTGRLKNNWFPGLNTADKSITGGADPSGAGSIARIQAGLEGFKVGQKIFITNSLPYARVIEMGLYGKPPGNANGPKTVGGFSKQAPAGMVRLTVQEYGQKIRKVVEQLKNE